MKGTFYAKVINGDLKLNNRKGFIDFYKCFEGKNIQITIEKKKKIRSSPQNRYFHGVVIPIVKQGLIDAGFNEFRNTEEVKDLIKYRFLKTTSVSDNGESIERIKHTSELSTSEFMDFMADVQQWANEFLGVIIPEPNEDLTLEL